jgi:hypothetical protein
VEESKNVQGQQTRCDVMTSDEHGFGMSLIEQSAKREARRPEAAVIVLRACARDNRRSASPQAMSRSHLQIALGQRRQQVEKVQISLAGALRRVEVRGNHAEDLAADRCRFQSPPG